MQSIRQALSDDQITLFEQAVMKGGYRLLLGAGYSTSSSGPDGNSLPLASRLALDTAEHFGLPGHYPLGQLANAIETDKFCEYLVGRFSGCSASSEARLLGSFVWRRIYTYNVDDVVDDVYRHSEVQKLKVVSRRDPYADVEDPGDVQVVYLHGSVSSPTDGFIFSTRSYADHIDEHSSWQYIFADELTHQPFIILGCALNEFDLEVLLARRASLEKLHARAYPSLFVTKDPDKVQEATCRKHGFTMVAATTDEFLHDLDTLTARRPSVLEILQPRVANQFVTAGRASARIFFSQWHHVGDLLVSEENATHAPHVLSGVEPGWEHVRRKQLLPRLDMSSLVSRAVNWAKGAAKSSVRVVYAPAGAGKTALLMLVGEALAQAGVTVYQLGGNSRITVDAAADVLRTISEPIVLVCDALADNIDQVSELLERLSGTTSRILVLGAERGTRQQLINDLASDLYLEASSVSPLTADEALSFVRDLRRLGLLGARAGRPDDELARVVLGTDLLPALLELTSNKSFAMRMRSEVEELDEVERRVYGILCTAHQHGHPLKLSVLRTAANVSMTRLVDILSSKLATLTSLRTELSEVQTRHRLVAEHAIQMFPNRYEYLVALVRAMRPYVNRMAIKQRLTEARLAGRLLDADVVRRTVGERTREFYAEIVEGWQWNSRYWEQRALATLDEEPTAALQYAEQAVGIEEHPMPLTTLAQVRFNVAAIRKYSTFEDRRLVVEGLHGAVQAIALSRRYHRREIHAHDVGVRGALRFLEHAEGKVDLRNWEGWKLLDEIVADLPRVKSRIASGNLRQMVASARSRFGVGGR